MARHARSDASHLDLIDDEFVGRFAVAGTPEHCVKRLTELAGLGIGRFVVAGPAIGEDPDHIAESRRLLVESVIPAVRSAHDRRTALSATSPATEGT
jgi:5,10-methylenetetrahydromethanopterin reductase